MKAALEQLCSNFGSVSKVCDDLVDQYFDQIWQALIKGIVSVLFGQRLLFIVCDCQRHIQKITVYTSGHI